MAISVANFTRETSITSGTGTYNLGGATGRYQTFVDAVGDGAKVYYHAFDDQDFESGIGTITDASPDTLSRDTILESSNADAAVNWPSSGQRTIIMTAPAQKTVLEDENDDVSIGRDLSIGRNLTATGQGTINPASALPPFVLNANAQGQKVVGLNADSVDGKEPATTTAETDGLVYWSSGTINSTGLLLQATNDGGIKQDTNYSVDTFLATGLVSSDPGLSFGTWRTPSASRPTWVIIDVLVVTDGSANSLVQVQVDDAGGTVADYTLSSEADEGLGANGVVQDSITLFLRPMASYRVTNPQDAAFLNAINNIREYEL